MSLLCSFKLTMLSFEYKDNKLSFWIQYDIAYSSVWNWHYFDSSLTFCIGVRTHGILEYTLRNVIALLGNLMEILFCSFDFSSLHCYLLSLCDWTPINWTLLTFLITLVWITILKLSSNQKQNWRDYIFDKITIPSCK